MFDGVRVALDDGEWFLVLPDATDPTLNLYAEASSGERVDHLIGDMSRHIEALVEA
jgi:phosphomannomutase